MKKLILIISLAFLTGNTFSQTVQEKDVPESVKTHFKTKFPNQTSVKWEKNDSIYEAGFVIDGMKTEVSFDTTGTWKRTEWEIPLEYTPAKIKEYIAANYTEYKTKELCVADIAGSEKQYIAEVVKKKESLSLYFSLQGEYKSQIKGSCKSKK